MTEFLFFLLVDVSFSVFRGAKKQPQPDPLASHHDIHLEHIIRDGVEPLLGSQRTGTQRELAERIRMHRGEQHRTGTQ